jgi:ubiquinone/menaquinone biosynthesis C-methylase UbiE
VTRQSSNPDASYELATRRHYQDAQVARAYHREYAGGFSLRRLSHLLVAWAERRVVRRLLAEIKTEVSRLADIPCGTGKLLPVFAGQGLRPVEGDVSMEMMQVARKSMDARSQVVAFVRLDATCLPLRDDSLDAVVCLRLLHRVPTDIKTAILVELHRVTSKYAIVSYGRVTPLQRMRLALRYLLTSRRTVPYGISYREVDSFFRKLGWVSTRRLAILPFLSAEEIALLQKV